MKKMPDSKGFNLALQMLILNIIGAKKVKDDDRMKEASNCASKLYACLTGGHCGGLRFIFDISHLHERGDMGEGRQR